MGDRVQVDPASLLTAGQRLSAQGDQLSEALRRAQSSLHALGDVCGNDSQGQQFAATYEPQSQQLLTAIGDMVTALHATRSGLEQMAATYGAVEQANTMRRG